MGVDTKIILPPGVKIDDVSNVLGIIVGLPHSVKPLRSFPDTVALFVPGVSTHHTHTPVMVEIRLEGDMVDGSTYRSVYYFFEAADSGPRGSRMLMPRSTPFWIAVGTRLVEFFGGSVDYNDCDDVDVDFEAPESHLAQSDGDAWTKHQYDMDAVVPVTIADIEAAEKYLGNGH